MIVGDSALPRSACSRISLSRRWRFIDSSTPSMNDLGLVGLPLFIPVQSIPLRGFAMRFLPEGSTGILRYPRLGGDSSNAGLPSCGEPDNQTPQDVLIDRRSARKSFRAVRCPAVGVESVGTPLPGHLEACKRGTETSGTWRRAIAPSAMRTALSSQADDGTNRRTIATNANSRAAYRTPSGEGRSIRRRRLLDGAWSDRKSGAGREGRAGGGELPGGIKLGLPGRGQLVPSITGSGYWGLAVPAPFHESCRA